MTAGLLSFDHHLEVEARMCYADQTRSCNPERQLDCFSPSRRFPGIRRITTPFRDRVFDVVTFVTHSGQKFRIRKEGKNQTLLTYKESREHPSLFVDDEYSRLVPGIEEALSFLSGEYVTDSVVRSTKRRTVYLVEMRDAELEVCFDTQNPDALYHLPEYIEIECTQIDGHDPLENPDSYIVEAEKRIIEVADLIGFDPSAFTKKTIRQMEEEYGQRISELKESCQKQLFSLERDFQRERESFQKKHEEIRRQFPGLRFSPDGRGLL